MSRIEDPLDSERGFRAVRALTALENISEWVGSIRGRRKAIVYLSEGIDYDVYDFQKRETTTIVDAMREVIASATRSNVSIYAVDPRGLTNMGHAKWGVILSSIGLVLTIANMVVGAIIATS